MKMLVPVNRVARRLRSAGLTILEMLISSAMLGLIIVGLTAMFVQTQKAFKTGIKQTDVGDAGRSISDMMAGDLSQLSDGTPFASASSLNPGITNLMWGWDRTCIYPQYENGVPFRTNEMQRVYMLVQTNTGWMGVGYAVSNMVPGLGVGTLYRYISITNTHFLDNHVLFDPFHSIFTTLFPQWGRTGLANTNNIHLDRIADGVVDLRIMPYDQYGNRLGIEATNALAGGPGYGDFYLNQVTNTAPYSNWVVNPLPRHPVAVALPASIDLELGILDPDAWDHLKGLAGNLTAQSNYLQAASGKIEIFRKHILVRAATLQ
jgi:hypothetical protein